jgi:hypothetical protein
MANGDRIKASPLSIGTMIAMVTLTLSGGMYVGGLSTTVVGIEAALAEDDEREKKDLAADRIAEQSRARIEQKQEEFRRDIDDLKEGQEKGNEKLDKILDELRKD